jgi:DNA-binding transcriptional LysR family regulator
MFASMVHAIDLSRVDLNLLVLFEAVMAERHVGRTGKRLHLSPSAISHGIARLRVVLHDPLFLKHPKGVVPTDRATELAPAIGEILDRVRGVLGSAEGFEPRRSTRRFTIGAPDAVFPAVLPPLLAALAKTAPQIDIAARTIMPQGALAELDARHVDLVIQPALPTPIPPRFAHTRLYEEEFAIALRKGHPLGSKLSLAQYCAASHVLVSATGDPHGNVDTELRKLGRVRRVAATVPSFLAALALVSETDLVAAVPRQTRLYAGRFGVVLVNPPAPLAPLSRSAINVIATRAGMTDAGIDWLYHTVTSCIRSPHERRASRS